MMGIFGGIIDGKDEKWYNNENAVKEADKNIGTYGHVV